ncbi:myosin-binding protein 1-like [Forsythia ovata]|uniref:Myosin-binding protein 1-like n=1 Tax=Forsythia ovata TaxID=205694 RepID=A0ABD1QPF8_9LAMI
MDSRGTPTVKFEQKVYPSIATALVRAVHEWLLIFMLFIDAGFSYLVTRFARYCQLQIPCLLCSRIDHVLGNERVGFYWDLMCHKHKLKISSLILCHLHDNLVDVHGTCESCFFSFATINKSNAETYRLLVGKLGAKPHYGLDQGSVSWEHNLCSSDMRKCSCCNEKLIPTSFAKKLIQTKSINSEEAELNAPLSEASAPNRNELKEIKDASSNFHHLGNNDADPLSHVEYSKINVTSDSEPETPFSDDESSCAVIHEMESPDIDLAAKYVQREPLVIDADPLSHVEYAKINVTSDIESETPFSDDESTCALIRKMESAEKDVAAEYVQPEPSIISLADNPDPEKLIYSASSTKLSLSELDANNSCCNTRSESPIGHHGLEELNWQQADHKNDDLVPSELISFDKVLQLPKVSGTQSYESKETDAKPMAELEREVTLEGGETSSCKVTSLQQMMTNSLDLSDAYKLAVGNKGRQLSGRLLEQQRSMKDSERASEDVKLLLSHISSRGIDLSLNDMSPRVSANSDDFRSFDASNAIGMQILRRISLERNESNISLDGSTVSEIEGESVIDQLTRQVEHDKKVIGALYKELEEERNASAVAANQAMSMITRLQEEKGALYTEALQCLRMTEEQAEYEGEALQKANDLLAEKEKEIQDLEAELELHKNKLGDVSSLGQFVMPSPESGAGKLKAAQLDSNCTEFNTTTFHSSNDDKFDVIYRIVEALKLFGDKDINTSGEVEDEKQYILLCLKQLEEKLNLFSKNEVYSEMTGGDNSAEEGGGASGSKELDYREVSQENGGM